MTHYNIQLSVQEHGELLALLKSYAAELPEFEPAQTAWAAIQDHSTLSQVLANEEGVLRLPVKAIFAILHTMRNYSAAGKAYHEGGYGKHESPEERAEGLEAIQAIDNLRFKMEAQLARQGLSLPAARLHS